MVVGGRWKRGEAEGRRAELTGFVAHFRFFLRFVVAAPPTSSSPRSTTSGQWTAGLTMISRGWRGCKGESIVSLSFPPSFSVVADSLSFSFSFTLASGNACISQLAGGMLLKQ